MANNIGLIDKPYISAVSSGLLDQREIARKIIDLQDDASWTQFMWELGRAERIASQIPHFDSFFNDPRFIIIDTTGATVTGSGTTTVTITGLSTAMSNIAIVSDVLLLPNGQNGRVQTKTSSGGQDTLTVKSVTSNALTLVAGDKLSVNSNAQEEGSSAPESQRWNLTSIRNLVQIFRRATTITDVQGMSYRTVEVDGDPHIIPQAFLDILQHIMADIAAACWAGEASDNIFENANPSLTGVNGRGVQTTRGINSYVNTFGLSPAVNTPGTISVFDVMNLSDTLTSVKAPNEQWLIGGNGPTMVLDNWLMNLGSSGAQSVRIVGGDGKDTNFMADKFTYGNYTWYIKREKLLSNPQRFNYVASGSTKLQIARRLYSLPYGKCKIYGGLNGGGGGVVDYFRYRYMAPAPKMGTGNSTINSSAGAMIMEALTGMYAPVPTSQDAVLTATFNANVGLEAFNSQFFTGWTVQ